MSAEIAHPSVSSLVRSPDPVRLNAGAHCPSASLYWSPDPVRLSV